MEQPKDLSQLPNVKLHKTKTGSFWLPTDAPDDVIIQKIIDGEIFDQLIFEAAQKFIRAGSVVLDVGACYGQMSTLFSLLVGDKGSVVGFEASPFVFRLYQANCAANGLTNCRIYNNAVWDKSGEEVPFMDYDFSHYKSYGCFGIDLRKGTVKVSTIKIDDIKFTNPIDFIKIDVQGSDLHALRGAERTLRSHRCPVIFEYESHYDEAFHVTWNDYLKFIDFIEYRIVENVNDWNFLIKPK